MQKSTQVGYAYCLEKARAAGAKEAINELERIGLPPYDSPDKVRGHFKWLGHYEAESDRVAESSGLGRLIFGAPSFSLLDIYNGNRGFAQIPTWRLYQDMINTDLPSLGTDFKVPIYFFQGTEDEVTPASLAREYFNKINAPRKEFIALQRDNIGMQKPRRNGGGTFLVRAHSITRRENGIRKPGLHSAAKKQQCPYQNAEQYEDGEDRDNR
jgi:hypothetical protein